MAQAHVIPQAITRVIPQHDWTIGVVGGSEPTGRGIAQAALRCGFHVRIVDAHRGAAEQAHAAIATALGWLTARDMLTAADRTAMLRRLDTCSSASELEAGTLVVDASADATDDKLVTLRDLDAAL